MWILKISQDEIYIFRFESFEKGLREMTEEIKKKKCLFYDFSFKFKSKAMMDFCKNINLLEE